MLTWRPDYRSAAGRNVRVSTAFQIYLDTRGNMELQIGYQSVTSHIHTVRHTNISGSLGEGGDEILYLKGECYIF